MKWIEDFGIAILIGGCLALDVIIKIIALAFSFIKDAYLFIIKWGDKRKEEEKLYEETKKFINARRGDFSRFTNIDDECKCGVCQRDRRVHEEH